MPGSAMTRSGASAVADCLAGSYRGHLKVLGWGPLAQLSSPQYELLSMTSHLRRTDTMCTQDRDACHAGTNNSMFELV